MLDQVKKFRKGKSDKIDFLEDLESNKKGGKGGKKTPLSHKKQFKDKKFGFGGKKKGGKSNTKDSTNNFSSKEFGTKFKDLVTRGLFNLCSSGRGQCLTKL